MKKRYYYPLILFTCQTDWSSLRLKLKQLDKSPSQDPNTEDKPTTKEVKTSTVEENQDSDDEKSTFFILTFVIVP